MLPLIPPRLLGVLGVVLLLSACAMPGDMDRLDQSFSRKVDSVALALRNEVKDLKTEMRTQERRHDDMVKLLDSLKTVIYSNAETLRRSNEALERETKALMQSMADEGETRAQLVNEHQQLNQTLSKLTQAVNTLTPLSTTLEGQVRQVTNVLQENVRTELKMLRERLRALEEMTKHVEESEGQGTPTSSSDQSVTSRQESRVIQ